MSARRLTNIIVIVVLVTSGTYLMVYLYRWEWNRALVSGVFFLTAQIALVASVVLNRLKAMEERLEKRIEQHDRHVAAAPAAPLVADPAVLERIREAAPEQGSPFAWLEESVTQGRTGVFVPVLLGAGVVLSGLAWLVERVAGATAGAAMEKGLARRMGALALPAGGLTPPRVVPLNAIGGELPAWRREPLKPRQIAARVGIAALAALGTVGALDMLADATQNRPDADLSGMITTVDLRIAHKANRPVADTAESLWFGCRGTLPRAIDARAITVTGPNTARFMLEPAVGEYARRRFEGCLQDATFDLVQAQVIGFDNSPKPTR